MNWVFLNILQTGFRYIRGFCIHCMFVFSSDVTKIIFTGFYACDIVLFKSIYISMQFVHICFIFFKNVNSSGVISL
jgi:hypothetical protein